jgi:hypothetical protein
MIRNDVIGFIAIALAPYLALVSTAAMVVPLTTANVHSKLVPLPRDNLNFPMPIITEATLVIEPETQKNPLEPTR